MMKTKFDLDPKLYLLLAVTLWASAFVGIRAGLVSYSPGGLALLRFIVASFCMLIVFLRLPEKKVIRLKDKCLLLLSGAFGLGFYNITLNYGEVAVPSGMASFIVSQSPIISAFLALVFLRESFSIYTFIGMIISIVGVGLITLSGNQDYNFHLGIIFVMLAMLTGSIFSVMQKPALTKFGATEVTVYIIWGATLSLLFFAPQLWHDFKTATSSSTISVIYLGIFPAAVAYNAWSHGLRAIPASRAVSYLYFMPVLATLLGWLWLNEVPSLLSLLGGLIALFGVWIVGRGYGHKTRKEKISIMPELKTKEI